LELQDSEQVPSYLFVQSYVRLLLVRPITVHFLSVLDPRKSKLRQTRSGWALLLAIVALGLVLRLFRLNHQSVWYDEIFSLTVSHYPFREMVQHLVQDLVQPPLHYFLLHVWFKLVGFGPYQARLLSVVFGTLAIAGVYLLGKYLFDHRAACIAASLVAVSQLAVMYSQEARPYAQLLFLTPFCAHLFLVALRTVRAGPWWGFVGLVVLMIYTHYYGFFAVGSFIVFGVLYWKKNRVPASRWIGGAALALALYLPWLCSGIVGEWLHSSKLARAPTRAYFHWWTVLTALNTFNNGRPAGVLESSPWWTFPLGGILFGVPALIALTPLIKHSSVDPAERLLRENVSFLVILFMIPFSAGLGVGFLSGAYNIRYITFAGVPYYVLIARGISVIHRPTFRATLLFVALAYSAYSLRANYSVPYKEDYRGAYAYLAQSRQAADCYVVAPPWEERQARWAWAIYNEKQPPLALAALDAVASVQAGCPRVWLISVTYQSTPPAVRESKMAQERLEQGYVRIAERRYFWVDLNLYLQRRH
jgi:mannosyltransferase